MQLSWKQYFYFIMNICLQECLGFVLQSTVIEVDNPCWDKKPNCTVHRKGIKDISGAWKGQLSDQELYRELPEDVHFPELIQNLGKQKIM